MSARPLRWLSLLLTACVSTPDFADASLIDRPRVLAIVAEPPELAPGQDVDLSIMLAGFEDVDYEVTWRVCGAYSTSVGGNQYGDADRDESCAGELSADLGVGEAITVPGSRSQLAYDNLDVARNVIGAAIPPDIVEAIIEEVGLVLTIEAVVASDERVWRATKAVIVNRASQHTNPPPPRFMLGDVEVVAQSGRRFHCEAADGGAVTVEPGEELELAPLVEGDEEPWIETYKAINIRGELFEASERAFYSWYATGGHLAEKTTRSPLRNNLWDTPGERGCHSLWNVVRDGHGGTSACRLEVAVGDGACD